MISQFVKRVKIHIKNNFFLYLIIAFCYLIGLSVGAFTVKIVDVKHKQELYYYMRDFFSVFTKEGFLGFEIMKQSFVNNFQLLTLSWLLGLLVITAPLVILIIVFKGFIIGFSTGILIEEFSGAGLLVLIFSVIPQNIIILVIFFLAAQLSFAFAWHTIKSRSKATLNTSFGKKATVYTVTYCILILTVTIAAFMEGYVAPLFIRLIFRFL
ncbi:stage II sporulation protein M [Serpentinicella alkaliphila]|uniref:Stage II sporulation protein M n=1 Tax=Serpentinicella alkaliphila TaxID=1734049 RepID=A0A4R2TI86_9FIRM|nr:stage II sporulation protein M [Serpentinicella alkaliphila]QUH26593.1 stage II sporulation protein M [Serpentinicella alkaliphila]TCQ02941.1 stage II sporulation protein M [Serpentinicella alkaliphila]